MGSTYSRFDTFSKICHPPATHIAHLNLSQRSFTFQKRIWHTWDFHQDLSPSSNTYTTLESFSKICHPPATRIAHLNLSQRSFTFQKRVWHTWDFHQDLFPSSNKVTLKQEQKDMWLWYKTVKCKHSQKTCHNVYNTEMYWCWRCVQHPVTIHQQVWLCWVDQATFDTKILTRKTITCYITNM